MLDISAAKHHALQGRDDRVFALGRGVAVEPRGFNRPRQTGSTHRNESPAQTNQDGVTRGILLIVFHHFVTVPQEHQANVLQLVGPKKENGGESKAKYNMFSESTALFFLLLLKKAQFRPALQNDLISGWCSATREAWMATETTERWK